MEQCVKNRIFLFMVVLGAFTSVTASEAALKEKYSTFKEHCILQSEYSSQANTPDKIKKLLIDKVKRDAVEELFGTQLKADTLIVDGKLVSDTIKQVAAGNVRIKGNPKFYNGKDFGEVCTKVEAYITEEDFLKYQPKTVKLKQFCYNNPEVSLKSLKSQARYASYKEVLVKYKPALKSLSNEKAESLMHQFSISNENLNMNTGVYCMDVVAQIYPYELELNPTEMDNSHTNSSALNDKNGLHVTFFSNNDYAMHTPIYETTLQKNLSLFGVAFPKKKIKKDRAYFVRLSGYLFSDTVRYAGFKLTGDVYSASVKINDVVVVSKQDPKNGIMLKAGLNPIVIEISSVGAYDITLAMKQADGSYKPVKLSQLTLKE